MKLSPTRVGLIVAAVLVVAGGIALLRPGPVQVEITRAARGPMEVTVDAEGQTRVRDRYVVAAPVAGRVARISLREGDPVTPQTVVARMFPAPLDARTREAAAARIREAEDAQRASNAAVGQARAALDQATRTRNRAQELAARNLIAPEERERAELEETTQSRAFESTNFRAQAAAHDVEVARAALQPGGAEIPLRAPLGGRVLRIPEPSERVVPAGTPLVEIGDPTKLEIVADLLSSDAVQVRSGDPVLIEGWGGGTLRGRVRVVEPSGFTKVSALGVEEQRVNAVGDLAAPPPSLGDRFRVELHVVVWESPSALRVPAGAVFRYGDGWAVFVVAAGRAHRRQVEVGHRNPFEAEILQGVKEGDDLIRNPSDRVADGIRVARSRPPG
jgi:HlyD family secretion protein